MSTTYTPTHLKILGPESIATIEFNNETIDFSLFKDNLSALSRNVLTLEGVLAEDAIYDLDLVAASGLRLQLQWQTMDRL